MPSHHGLGSGAQALAVDRPGEPDHRLHRVVVAVAAQAGVEVDAGLDRRQRPHVGQRRVALPQPVEVGLGEPYERRARVRRLGRALGAGQRGQRRDGFSLEHVAWCESQPGRPGQRHQSQRHDAVAAEGEEVAVGRDGVELEHLGEQPRHGLFGRRGGRPARLLPGSDRPGAQRFPIDLADRSERQVVEYHDRGGDHVVRERTFQIRAQRRHVQFGAGRRDDVGHQHRFPGGTALIHGGDPRDGGPAGQVGVDLARLDPQTVDLDLLVVAAKVGQFQAVAAAYPADRVAGAVEPFAGPVRVGDETCRGQARPLVVAAGQPRPADVEFTGDAHRHGPQPGVEYPHRRAGDRRADGDLVAGPQFGRAGRPDRGLGGSVVVQQATTRSPAPHEVGAGRLAHDRDRGQRWHPIGCHRAERGRGDDRVGDVLAADQVLELRPAVDLRRCDRQARTAAVRQQQLRHARVETR